MDHTTNSLNWFEIPANDLQRCKTFYEVIFGITMELNSMDNSEMAFFPWSPGSGKATGAVVKSSSHTPSMEGTIVYLNANPNMDGVLSRVAAAGGRILMSKTSIGEFGHIAFISDTEGNKVGIHSNQ